MPLLLQLNADLPEHFPNDERWLYVFGCTRRTCSRKVGSVRALRGVRKFKVGKEEKKKNEMKEEVREEKREEQKPKVDIGASLFGVAPSGNASANANANPFSTSSSTTTAPANPFAPLPQPSTLAAIPPQKADTETQIQTQTQSQSLPQSFADKVRVSSRSPPPSTKQLEPIGPPTPWPGQSAFPKPYPHYYLDAEYETLSRPSTPEMPTSVPMIEEEAGPASAGDNGKDAFESSIDKDFLRFSTRLGHNPEQVLRYEWRGTPLLYASGDAVGKLFSSNSSSSSGNVKTASREKTGNKIPRCESCGKERVFEVQLVPHAISVLEEGREGIGFGPKDECGMEWGTVILGVCAANCGLATEGVVGWREEWVGVQWEERVGK